jgi:hypothetical protein
MLEKRGCGDQVTTLATAQAGAEFRFQQAWASSRARPAAADHCERPELERFGKVIRRIGHGRLARDRSGWRNRMADLNEERDPFWTAQQFRILALDLE